MSKLSLKGKLKIADAAIDAVKSNREEIAFEQLGTGGPPRDPGPSAYPDEAGFEAARRAVLENGARQVTINIESQSAFRADSDLADRLKKVGFSLGISGEKSQVRLLRLEAYFPERGKLHVPDERRVQPVIEAKPPLDPDAAEAKRGRARRR